MSKGVRTAEQAIPDSDVFHRFVFDGQNYPPERIEQAVRAVQQQLGSAQRCRVNDALLARLTEAKKAHGDIPKRMLLDDPTVSTLVNTLALVNRGWITTVIANAIRARKHLHGHSVDELYSTALTGGGAVGGVMWGILQYDYQTFGTKFFTHYLSRVITNALSPTPTQKKFFQRVESRMRSIYKRDEDGAEPGWVDRMAPRPEAAAINHELVELVKSVIPDLPTQQQRETAAWMIDRILDTGELPMQREVAQIQRPRVSVERGRQIMAATVNNIRRLIEADYPQLAEQGINGWEQCKEAFNNTKQAAQIARAGNGRLGRGA